MVKGNTFRFKKPYNKTLDDAIVNGSALIDLQQRKKYPTGYNQWMYFLRKERETKSYEVKNVRSNLFLLVPTKKMTKNKKKSSGGKYAFYEVF